MHEAWTQIHVNKSYFAFIIPRQKLQHCKRDISVYTETSHHKAIQPHLYPLNWSNPQLIARQIFTA